MSSGFISEAEIAEQRKLRQEEWNRVRTADQPEGKNSYSATLQTTNFVCNYKEYLLTSLFVF